VREESENHYDDMDDYDDEDDYGSSGDEDMTSSRMFDENGQPRSKQVH